MKAPPMDGSLRVRFWGVRGTLPAPGPDTCRYGGNTACVEVRFADQLLILDAGTGIRKLGLGLQSKANGRPITGAIFLSHSHWDHIHGLPYFAPAFVPGNRFRIYGCAGASQALESTLAGQMENPYFPLPMSAMPATLEFRELKEEEIALDGVRVKTKYLHHPGLTLAFRIEAGGKSLVYATDNEPCHPAFGARAADHHSPGRGNHDAALAAFAAETDLLISDAQYTGEEYPKKVGWGHSSIADAMALAVAARARRLALFHHDPERTDAQLDAIVADCRAELGRLGAGVDCFAAQEGVTLTL